MVRGMLMGDVIQAVSKEMFGGSHGAELAEQSLRQLDSVNIPAAEKQRYRDVLIATRNLRQGSAQDSAPVAPPGMTMPYSVKEEPAMANDNAAYNGYAHAFAGMGIQFLLFAAIDLGIGILLERQRGLWKRLRSAPLSKGMLLGGKMLSGTLITLLTLLVSFTFAILVFKVRISGSVIGFFAIAAATALMASTFGLLIAAVGKTPNATRGVAILAVLLMVMLGGAWVPSFIFPQWLQQATVVIPARWAVDGLDAMTWRGIGLSGAVLPTVVLLGFAALFGGLAVLRFQWDEA
jgi:ABC-2 type transport system permease protein